MAILVLPIIVLASRESLRRAPPSVRDASLALDATKRQTTWAQVLPIASSGILPGCILAFSRALGETAPLVTLGGLNYVPFLRTGRHLRLLRLRYEPLTGPRALKLHFSITPRLQSWSSWSLS